MTIQRFAMMGAALAILTCTQPADAQTVTPVEQTPYHVPVFSNDYVTVLNVFIPPQRTSGLHRHSLDSVEVLIVGTELAVQRPDGTVRIGPKRPTGAIGFAGYNGQPAVHGVTVTGDTPFHNIVIELLKPSAQGLTPSTREGIAEYAPALDNERVRAWRLVLDPGQQAPPITQTAPGIRVVIAGGEIVERVPGSPDRAMALRGGDFYWRDGGTTRGVQNTGTTRIEFVEIELK